MAPIRHPAPAGEMRLEYSGQCWVWAQLERHETDRFVSVLRHALPRPHSIAASWWGNRHDMLWIVRTRGPRPPWPTFIDQRDPGDERVEDDGFITVWPGPSEGFTTPAGGA